MPRSPRQKLKLLYLRDYLLRCADEAHPVTVAQMIEYLDRQGVSAERKSIYDDIETLRSFGLDIIGAREGSQTKYFVGQRDFQLAELKLLVDSVQASKFITRKKSMELIGKLESLASESEARQLQHQVWVRGRVKTMNESIFMNVDALQNAIAADRAVTFLYYDWSPRRERVFRRDGKRYAVSPWALLYDDDNYYLLAYDHEAGFMKHFRVDKMVQIRQTRPRQGAELFERIDMAAYTDTHFGMFSGSAERVRLLFQNELAGPVIDRFGTDIALVPEDGAHFSVTVSAAVNAQFFGWLCGFGPRVRILSPASAAEGMRAHLAAISALYDQ